MGLGDNLKKLADDAKKKMSGLAGEHGDKIDGGIDKAADTAKQRFGKHGDKIDDAADKTKDYVDRLDEDEQR